METGLGQPRYPSGGPTYQDPSTIQRQATGVLYAQPEKPARHQKQPSYLSYYEPIYQDPNTMKSARQKSTEVIFEDPQILELQHQRQLQAAPIMPGDLYAQPDNPRPPKLPPRQVPVYRQVEKPNVSTPCIIIMCVLVETLHVNEYCNTLCPNAKC